ncbi:unnamed protein product [Microthlaspi erraticum]|nr:unnamed protein product [Microthlaspi erraticum]
MKFNLTRSSDEAVCVFQGTDDDHTLSMILLHPWGAVVGLVWKGSWQIVWLAPKSFCEVPNYCGKNSFCCATEPVDPDTFMSMPKATCKCILGYHPMKSGESIGVRPCERQAELSCSANEFHPFKTVKLPATASTNSFITPGLEQCKDKCLQNCECKAYSVFAYGNGSLTQNCTTWSGDLTDLGCYNSSAAQTLYIRQNGEMKTKTKTKKKKKMSIIVYVIIGLSVSALCLLCVALYCYRKRIQKKLTPAPAATDEVEMRLIREGATDDHESLPQMEFSTIVDATENFSHLIGRGGFGNVYKGLLPDGTEIAVKKLSEQSNQGNEEFYTEATSIRRLRHVNIVRLYGWSVHNDDKLLIYEYLENGSLERHLFSEPSGGGGDLDWPRRYHIVKGIAQGLAYIEEGFQDTIVHRDLKPANILLDTNMTPKISDFGFARVYGRAEDEAFTERPSGTYGYMAPEYMQGGSYSAKSDIFSFGVTVLEILSCKRNKTFAADMGLNVNLLEYAWIKLDQGDYLEVVDEKIRGDSLPDWQVLRCVQVALLCVQQQASERPNMSLVVTMLQEEDYPTPKPLRPGVIAVASTSSCQDPSGSTPTHIIEPITQVYPR